LKFKVQVEGSGRGFGWSITGKIAAMLPRKPAGGGGAEMADASTYARRTEDAWGDLRRGLENLHDCDGWDSELGSKV
jgi:hypothetical protein